MFSTTFGAILNSEIIKKREKCKKKKIGTRFTTKRTPVHAMKIKARRQSVTLSKLSWEPARWGTLFSPLHSAHTCK